MHFGIAFEGCAGKAAFHIGAMERLTEQGLSPAAVSGASSGAIVATLVACGKVAALRDIWLSVCGQRVFQPQRLLRAGWPFAMSDIVGDAVSEHVGDLPLSDVPMPIAIVVTQLVMGKRTRRVLTNNDTHSVADVILASCYLPGPYSRMIPIDGRLTFDGAWQRRAPVDIVPEPVSRKVIACIANPAGELAGGFFRPTVLPVPDYCRILAPIEPLPVGAFDLGRSRMEAAMQIGADSADAFLERNQQWLQSRPQQEVQ